MFFDDYRVYEHLTNHPIKIVIYLVNNILLLKLIFLTDVFLVHMDGTIRVPRILVHIDQKHLAYQEFLVREMVLVDTYQNSWYTELYAALPKVVG